jgi:DNA relaxase NicK
MEHQPTRITLLERGIDWITATGSTQDAARSLRTLATIAGQAAEGAGNKRSPAGGHGYRGWQCGPVYWGERAEDVCVTISGGAAHLAWRHVVNVATNVSRIDVQATVRYSPDAPKLAQESYQAWIAGSNVAIQKRRGSLHVGYPSGETAYFGSPKSDARARLYDKGAESGAPEYAGAWRWEVQARNKMAAHLARRLAGDVGGDVPAGAFLRDHFGRIGAYCPDVVASDSLHVRVPRSRSDFDRRSSWIKGQIKPICSAMAAVAGWPYVLELLGAPAEAINAVAAGNGRSN